MDPLIRIAYEWAIRCFGRAHVHDPRTRALRCVEETIEMAQAYEIDPSILHMMVDKIYARPRGNAHQEIGGVLLTAYVLCAARGSNPESLFLDELCRVLGKPPEHFAKRNADKMEMGFSA